MKSSQKHQYLVSISSVLLVSVLCYYFNEPLGYKTVALLLLMTVSVIAMVCDILPVIIGSILSALIWNFFFIPPVFTFHIDTAEDVLMFALYFVIALVNGTLTYKIRQAEKKARAKEEQEKTIKLYATLLNSLSHELKTPISTILGSIDTIRENHKELNHQQELVLFDEIQKAGLRLNRQVENLLNMSRLESDTLLPKLDWFDLNELIHSVIQKFESTKQAIIFRQNDSLPLYKSDSGFLEQILYNLLHNAFQYSGENARITIETRLSEQHIAIVISDNGPGIPISERAHVFEKFYRLSTTQTGGTGLGLSIVKGFVEALNGTIQIDESDEGGAKFILSIPAETSFIQHLNNE